LTTVKLLNSINRLSSPVMKTWISHGMVGYAKKLNFEHLYLWMHSSSLSDHFFNGQICMEGLVQIKRVAVKID
jgi:hypothetical protein